MGQFKNPRKPLTVEELGELLGADRFIRHGSRTVEFFKKGVTLGTHTCNLPDTPRLTRKERMPQLPWSFTTKRRKPELVPYTEKDLCPA